MANSIQDIQKQAFRYYYQDGLAELAVGILFLIIGLDTWIISIVPFGSQTAITAWIALPILTIGGIFGVQRFVKNLKERHVHPRTGYIQYAIKPNRYRWLVISSSLILAVSVLILPYSWLQKGSVTGGMILFVILASIGAQVGLKRLITVGSLSMVLGLVFGILPSTDPASLAATFVGTGLILALTGGLVFRKYLVENPIPEEDTNV